MPPTFADLGVPAPLVRRLGALGFTDAFPIQAAALPDALAGRDVVGRAATGSGKTLAFGLALLARLERARPRRPRALVLTPTRELAAQVERELASVGASGQRILSVYGGTPYAKARRALAAGVDVVVACPGRLEDLLAQGTLSLADVTTVVVDEADRMVDLGFLPAVRRLLAQTSPERQTMLFSATMGPEVRSLVAGFTRDAATHDVVDDSAPADVDHHFWRVTPEDRVDTVARVITQHGRAIVFTRTKHGADRLAKQLGQRGVSAVALHGDRSQAQRERALAAISNGRADALVATDVAARGIHVEALPAVVHYDPPRAADDYTHRSGRTGRAGATGTVVSLVTDDLVGHVHKLQRSLGFEPGVGSPDSPPARAASTRGDADARASAPREPRARRDAAARPRPARVEHRAPPATGRHRARSGEAMVTFFNGRKGFGFASDGGDGDLFVHYSRIEGEGFRTLTSGQRIAFDEVRGPRGREAHRVRVLGAGPSRATGRRA